MSIYTGYVRYISYSGGLTMNFKTAMEALESGKKVTRKAWKDIYYLIDGKEIKCYQPSLSPYSYNEEIMLSKEWLLNDGLTHYAFYEIIDFLRQGHTARMSDWSEGCYIYFDKELKVLVSSTIQPISFTPDFASFIAEDWMILE